MSPRSEFRDWIRSWLFPFGMTEAFGLAAALVRSGLQVVVFKEREDFRLRLETGRAFDIIANAFGRWARLCAERYRRLALSRGVEVRLETVDLDLLRKATAEGLPAIVMVNQSAYAPDARYPEGILHWVVVLRFQDEVVIFHDPDLGPGQAVHATVFERAMDLSSYGLDRQCVIAATTSPAEALRFSGTQRGLLS